MSLYKRLFGENKEAPAILGFAGLTRGMFMRYRDCFLNPEGTVVTVITRIGGENRHEYRQAHINIKRHPNYIRDYDDDFDDTYCYFEFKVDDKFLETAKKIAPKEQHPSIHEMFKKECEEANIPGSPAAKRQEEIAKLIFEAMKNGEHTIDL